MPFVPTIRTTYDRHHHQPPIMLVTLRPVREWILVCFSPPIPRNLPRTFFPFLSLSFLLSFLLFSPYLPFPLAPRLLLSFHRTAYTFLRATLTIPVFTAMRRLFPTRRERKKERKIFSREGKKERKKISFLSFPCLACFLFSFPLEEYYYHSFTGWRTIDIVNG